MAYKKTTKLSGISDKHTGKTSFISSYIVYCTYRIQSTGVYRQWLSFSTLKRKSSLLYRSKRKKKEAARGRWEYTLLYLCIRVQIRGWMTSTTTTTLTYCESLNFHVTERKIQRVKKREREKDSLNMARTPIQSRGRAAPRRDSRVSVFFSFLSSWKCNVGCLYVTYTYSAPLYISSSCSMRFMFLLYVYVKVVGAVCSLSFAIIYATTMMVYILRAFACIIAIRANSSEIKEFCFFFFLSFSFKHLGWCVCMYV